MTENLREDFERSLKIWLDNNEAAYCYVMDNTKAVMADRNKENRPERLGKTIKNYLACNVPENMQSVYSDFISVIIQHGIDYQQIARHYINEFKLEIANLRQAGNPYPNLKHGSYIWQVKRLRELRGYQLHEAKERVKESRAMILKEISDQIVAGVKYLDFGNAIDDATFEHAVISTGWERDESKPFAWYHVG